MASTSSAVEATEDADEATSVVEEPQDYWEKEAVANQIANFDGAKGQGDDIPMLVAVRVRPMWDKVRPARGRKFAAIFFRG